MILAGRTVLVTGATGFLGGYLVARLAAEGVQVKALARRPERDKYIRDLPGVEVVTGDITDPTRMDAVMRGCDVVFHVAAALGGNMAHQRRVNTEGTRNVMYAAAAANVQRVIHVSTIALYGYRNTGDVTESTPAAPGADPYPITKLEAEQQVREIAASQSLNYTIIRPGMIYGPRANTWTKTAFQLAKRKPTPWLGSGRGSAYPIYVDDVVDLCYVAATHPDAVGEVFNCTPDPSPTWRDYIGAYQALAGHDRWLAMPVSLARVLGWAVSRFAPRYSQARDLPELIPFLDRYITYRMDKAWQRLGWRPQVDLRVGVESCVPYLREKGLLK